MATSAPDILHEGRRGIRLLKTAGAFCLLFAGVLALMCSALGAFGGFFFRTSTEQGLGRYFVSLALLVFGVILIRQGNRLHPTSEAAHRWWRYRRIPLRPVVMPLMLFAAGFLAASGVYKFAEPRLERGEELRRLSRLVVISKVRSIEYFQENNRWPDVSDNAERLWIDQGTWISRGLLRISAPQPDGSKAVLYLHAQNDESFRCVIAEESPAWLKQLRGCASDPSFQPQQFYKNAATDGGASMQSRPISPMATFFFSRGRSGDRDFETAPRHAADSIDAKSHRLMLANLKNMQANEKGLPTKIEIVGFADNLGSTTLNQRLSEARARTIQRFLIRAGIPATLISVRGGGIRTESCAQGSQASHAACNANNRRAEVFFHR